MLLPMANMDKPEHSAWMFDGSATPQPSNNYCLRFVFKLLIVIRQLSSSSGSVTIGGTIQAGTRHVDCPALGYKKGDTVNIADAFESFGAFKTGKISEEERFDVVRHACPGAGGCGGM